MIGKLTGLVDTLAQDHVLLDVNGVGYVVFASSQTLSKLGARGTRAGLLIETHVREDHIHLYGFADEAERGWFRLLTTVQGVGSRVGLAILSALSAQQLTTAILAQDKTALQRAEGVGPKLAARLLTELKDRLPQGASPMGAVELKNSAANPANSNAQNDMLDDAVSALVNLGYGRSEAYNAVLLLKSDDADMDLSSLVRRALQNLSSHTRKGVEG